MLRSFYLWPTLKLPGFSQPALHNPSPLEPWMCSVTLRRLEFLDFKDNFEFAVTVLLPWPAPFWGPLLVSPILPSPNLFYIFQNKLLLLASLRNITTQGKKRTFVCFKTQEAMYANMSYKICLELDVLLGWPLSLPILPPLLDSIHCPYLISFHLSKECPYLLSPGLTLPILYNLPGLYYTVL
jgi:hypothetical protein